MTVPSRTLPPALLLVGLGGALLSSSILAGATLLLAIAGGVFIARKSPYKAGWDTPKELRLLHFAFWFFVLVSVCSWLFEGFDYEGSKTLGSHARFLVFWPLVIALSYIGLRAQTMFVALGLVSLSAIGAFISALASQLWSVDHLLTMRFGGGINPISFGNLALLGGILTLVGASFFLRTGKRVPAALFAVAGVSAAVISMLSETRSNLVALPFLLLVCLPLVGKKARIAGLILIPVLLALAIVSGDRMAQSVQALMNGGTLDNGMAIRLEVWGLAWDMFMDHPWTGVGLGGYTHVIESAVANGDATQYLLTCCSGHAHSDFFNNAATSGIPGILSWALVIFIPLAIFARHLFSKHLPTAHLATAGVLVSVGYFFFGLTEATFNRNLFLTFYLLAIAGIASALFHELSASYVRQRNRKVSATIITKNEEAHIADCLKSARLVADEVIVLDSGSSDRTAEIAREYADVVEVTDWPGFGIQKQRALEKATGEWVLSLDADERVTPELAREINHHLADPDADAYKLPWAVTIYGTRLDFGRSGRAPLRLFRREGVSFSDALVHERILIPEGRKVKTLRGRLTHYTHRDFGHSLEKSAKYAWLGSLEKHRKGKKTRTMLYPTLRGLMTFVQVYFIRFGFLDGAVGYLTAVTYAQVTFNKYAGLWTLSREERSNKARE
ncbi:glycosyltransferase [Marinobacter sp. M216]|uniref:Glycosyltransferase n=1 Tax=Marinobacter albus TaxID=3030833 RepID=A0ABT7HGU1_9GAMM|nr:MULTISPECIES: O-antigen ligase family protein [unclassified Marinobacter]MBW7473023.1 glycosyltransferase [Marinobacter sp. F4218]MDK9559584.1 glycosyltransferase [Marinobacter sp. M216]